jgi:hypothetical protein
MAIKTSTFSGVNLTGDAAKAFKKQFLSSNAQVNPLAQSSLEKGRRMLKELRKNGYIIANPLKK